MSQILKNLKKLKEKQKMLSDSVNSLKQEEEVVIKQTGEAKKELADLGYKIDKKEGSIKNIDKRLARMNEQSGIEGIEIEASIARKKSEEKEMSGRIKSLEIDLSSIQKDIIDKKEEQEREDNRFVTKRDANIERIEKIEEIKKNALKEVGALEADRKDIKAELENVEVVNKKISKKVFDKKVELSGLEKKIDIAKVKISELEKVSDKWNDKMSILKAERDSLETEIKELSKKVGVEKKELEDSRRERMRMSKKAEELRIAQKYITELYKEAGEPMPNIKI